MSLPGARSLTYNYDNAGRLANVTDWVSGQVSFGYDPDGNLSSIARPNGVNSAYGYDAAGRLNNINHQGPGGSLLNFAYTLDANGNRTAVTSNAGNETYTLDELSRLTNILYSNGDSASLSYDANGNRLSRTVTLAGGSPTTLNYSYDDAGQLLAAGTISYTYDANGNLTGAGTDSYTWDYDNRLIGTNVGGIATSYGYDAFGVRTSSVISSLNTSYLWDRLAENPLLIDDGSHAYVYADGPLAQIDTSNNRQYLLTDALNSVRGLSDNSGTLVGSINYNAFGGIRSQSGASSILGFTGEVYNPQTQLLHLRARDYAVTLGRLLSADTVSPNAHEAQGYNLYAYVANNPTSWVDPSGHNAAGFAPPMDPNQFIEWTRNMGEMMQHAVESFRISTYGNFMLNLGSILGTLVELAGGAVAFNVVVGIIAAAALLAMGYLIWSCLINKLSPCFQSSTMQNLREMTSSATFECVSSGSEGKAVGQAILGAVGMNDAAAAFEPRNCLQDPEEEEERKIPTIVFGADVMEVSVHIQEAIPGYGTMLNYSNKPDRKIYNNDPKKPWRYWYYDTSEEYRDALGLPNGCLGKPDGDSRQCDEYPFYATSQGYPVQNPSLKLVNGKQNRDAGGYYSLFIRKCLFNSEGSQFLVEVQLSAPTTTSRNCDNGK